MQIFYHIILNAVLVLMFCLSIASMHHQKCFIKYKKYVVILVGFLYFHIFFKLKKHLRLCQI